MSTRSSAPTRKRRSPDSRPLTRIAVAVDGDAGADDAFALAGALAGSPQADLLAMTVIPDFSLIAPWASSDPMRHDVELQMRRMRDACHPRSRIAIDRDYSVARGLCRMVVAAHRELLVVGSSHRADDGQVRLSGHTRQLIDHLPCPLVFAPRGLASRPVTIRRVAVGLDGSADGAPALVSATRLAATMGAELIVCAVVDDAPPTFGWPPVGGAGPPELWSEAIEDRMAGVRDAIRELVAPLQRPVAVDVRRGTPAELLTELSEHVDLLVLGSRRWGTVARLVLGGTGEALVHRSRCPLAIVPRPAHAEEEPGSAHEPGVEHRV